MIYQQLGPLSFVTLWLAMGLLLLRRTDHSLSLSQHAGAERLTFLGFGTVSTLAAVGFSLYAYQWLIPTFGLPSLSYGIISLAAAGQVTAAWTPHNPHHPLASRIHGWGAYTMAVLMMVIAGLIAFTGTIAPIPHALSIGLTSCMMTMWLLFIFVPATRRHYLPWQISYIVAFQIQILIVTWYH